MCLVAFQKIFRKIFSDVWLCSWKYHRKHIFYLLLIFSRLPNEYIISFISQNTNKTQKKIIKFEHFAQLRSARRRDCDRHGRRFARSWSKLCVIVIGVVPVMSVDDIGELGFGRSLSLSLSLSLFYFPRPEIIWSENGNGNDFPLFWLSFLVNWKWFSVNWKCFSVWPNLK